MDADFPRSQLDMSRDASFIPPVNTFAMLLRMASNTPPSPGGSVALDRRRHWLRIRGDLVCAKVFRIGLLMYGNAQLRDADPVARSA